MAAGADHDPSSSLATTNPAPPAPPSGAMPLRIEVKIARPFAFAMTDEGILRMIFFFDFFSCVMTPLTGAA